MSQIKPIVFIVRDIERAFGKEPSPMYLITTNKTPFSEVIKKQFPDFIDLIESPDGKILDTIELLEYIAKDNKLAEMYKMVDILVFKNNTRIQELAKKNGWNILNPSAELAEKVENKITQVEWLGELASYLPEHKIEILKNVKWDKKTLVIQFAHSHSGLGTIIVNSKVELESIQEKFPDRPVRVSSFLIGPSFTVNVVVTSELVTSKKDEAIKFSRREASVENFVAESSDNILIGNISYQITGLPPFTDNPFTTIGNDWSLTHTILNEREIGEIETIARKVGERMATSGWKGLFGIDVIRDDTLDKIFLIEVNARQPASTSFESILQSENRKQGVIGMTIFEAHLDALKPRSDLGIKMEESKNESKKSTDLPPSFSNDRVQSPPVVRERQGLISPRRSRTTGSNLIPINDGSQIIQRVTSQTEEISRPKITKLNTLGYKTILYSNTEHNSDLLRIQSSLGIMETHGKFNKRGKEIVEILE